MEDNANVRAFIRDALADFADVVEAENADQALTVLGTEQRKRLDLVIVDCILPSGSRLTPAGVRLVGTISAQWPWIPVVAITGALEAERLLLDATRSGARGVLRKPFGIPALTEAIDRVTRSRRRREPGVRPGTEVALQRVIAFIGEHYTERLSLADVAGMAAMSRSHFCRMFRSATGVSFRDYVRDLRLTRAQQLLAASGLSLTDVALEIGFYDLPHFDKAFRKRFGVSPTEFVRRKALSRATESRAPEIRPRSIESE